MMDCQPKQTLIGEEDDDPLIPDEQYSLNPISALRFTKELVPAIFSTF